MTAAGARAEAPAALDRERLASGHGRFAGDVAPAGAGHLALVRSTVAHATVRSVDTAAAEAVPGVVAVLTAADLRARGVGTLPGGRPVLAGDTVLFQGQEVVAVVAGSPYVAADAAELVEVEYEPHDVVVDPTGALAEPGPSGSVSRVAGDGPDLEDAPAVVRLETTYPRSHPAPLETSGCVVVPGGTDGLTEVWLTSESPEAHGSVLAEVAGLSPERVAVRKADLGGGFGGKSALYPGHVLALVAAEQTGRPIRWTEVRSETHVATTAAGDCRIAGALALDADGRAAGVDLELVADGGAYLADDWDGVADGALAGIRSGYDLGTAQVRVTVAPTHKSPASGRVHGLPRVAEVTWAVESLLTRAALERDGDPLQLRLALLDEGSPARAALAAVAEAVGYESVRHRGQRDAGRGVTDAFGVGLSLCASGENPHDLAAFAAAVRVDLRTGEWAVERVAAAHGWPREYDVSVRGGLVQGYGLASMQVMSFDAEGNCSGANFMDYLLPTSWEAPTVDVRRIPGHGEAAEAGAHAAALTTAGSVPAYVGAVIDALAQLGVRQLDLPATPGSVWEAIAAGRGAAA